MAPNNSMCFSLVWDGHLNWSLSCVWAQLLLTDLRWPSWRRLRYSVLFNTCFPCWETNGLSQSCPSQGHDREQDQASLVVNGPFRLLYASWWPTSLGTKHVTWPTPEPVRAVTRELHGNRHAYEERWIIGFINTTNPLQFFKLASILLSPSRYVPTFILVALALLEENSRGQELFIWLN